MSALRWDSELPWTVQPVKWYSGIGQTVGYGAGSSGGKADSHGQSHLSLGTVGSNRILKANLDIPRLIYNLSVQISVVTS